jgi:EAL domain-containing protein (putative c-di-GMP-specific phosphodiesterase class I)
MTRRPSSGMSVAGAPDFLFEAGGPWPPSAEAGVAFSADASRTAIRSLLATARSHLRMEVAFVSRFAGGRRWFEFVDTQSVPAPVAEGGGDPLKESYCLRVVEGLLPALMKDAQTVREARELPATETLPVGAHLSVPLRGASGEALGTLCCFSRTPDEDLRDRDVDLLRMFGDLISPHLVFLLEHEERARDTSRLVSGVITNRGPRMAIQPIVEVESGRVAGYEALSRFPRHSHWNPQTWFEAAGDVGLGPELEAAAVAAALELLPRLPTDVFLTINGSVGALCRHGVITEMLVAAPGDRVVLELTEHDRITRPEMLDLRLRRLRRSGIRIAVDDAGSGYAGLERIMQLDPEILKLDRALVDGIARHHGRQAMCSAMASFARATDALLIAEGVERADDLDALRALGVGHAQGFHLGRPADPDVYLSD